MAVKFQMNDYAVLEKAGVPGPALDKIKAAGFKVITGKFTIGMKASNGMVVAEKKLKGPVSSILDGTDLFLADTVSMWITEEFIPKWIDVPKSSGSPVQFGPAKPYTGAGAGALPVASPHMEPIPLRDATAIYQRVRGTAEHNYFVVALADEVKFAVKISGMHLSVRAEGSISPVVALALKKVGMDMKQSSAGFSYASVHMACTPEAPPEKVIGAILFATGLSFNVVCPNMEQVKALAKAVA